MDFEGKPFKNGTQLFSFWTYHFLRVSYKETSSQWVSNKASQWVLALLPIIDWILLEEPR